MHLAVPAGAGDIATSGIASTFVAQFMFVKSILFDVDVADEAC